MKLQNIFCLILFFLTTLLFSQFSKDQNWVYNDGEKFFPIGIWYTRGYDINQSQNLNIIENATDFEQQFGSFNTIYVDQSLVRTFMLDKVLLVGNGEFVSHYLNSMAQTVEAKSLEATTAITNYWKNSNYKHIYILDEPLNGLTAIAGSKEYMYQMINKWNEVIKSNDSEALTYIDFVSGCISYPDYPCPELIDFSNNVNFEITSHQHYSANGDAPNNTLKYVQRQKVIVKSPTWMFLEAQRRDFTGQVDDFIVYKNTVRARAFISIIHGATGILFWKEGLDVNDPDYNSNNFNFKLWEATKQLAGELQSQSYVFKGDLLNSTRIGNLHTGLFKATDNKYYYIVVNGSHTENETFYIPNVENKVLQPLEVYIKEYSKENISYFNSDRKDDLLIRDKEASKYFVARSNGTEFPYSPDTLWEEGFGVASQELKVGDFNGDGKDDLLIRDMNDSKYYVSLSNGINEFIGAWPSEWLNNFGGSTDQLHIGDFNGDGKDDLLTRNKENAIYSVKLSNGTKFLSSSKVIWEEGFGVANQELKIGDFNGDGKDDLLIWNKGTDQSESKYYVSLSNGIDEFKGSWPSIWLTNFGVEGQELHVGNFNGDEKDDLLIWDKESSKYFVALSNGTEFPHSPNTLWEEGFGTPSQELKIGDFNRDGLDDILLWNNGQYQSDSKYHVALSNGTNEFEPTWPSIWLTDFGVRGQQLHVGSFDDNAPDGLSTKMNLESKLNNDINFSPNPFKEKLSVQIRLEITSNVTMSVFDMNGNQIIEQKIGEFSEGEKNIPIPFSILSKLAKGIYISKILIENDNVKKTEHIKIIRLD